MYKSLPLVLKAQGGHWDMLKLGREAINMRPEEAISEGAACVAVKPQDWRKHEEKLELTTMERVYEKPLVKV